MIEEPQKIKRVIEGLRRLHDGGYRPDGLFADAADVIQSLCAEVSANEFVYAEKDAAMDAVNEGSGIPDDDCWARMKGQRDQLLEACEAFIGSSIAGGRAFDESKAYDALQLANKAVQNVRVGR